MNALTQLGVGSMLIGCNRLETLANAIKFTKIMWVRYVDSNCPNNKHLHFVYIQTSTAASFILGRRLVLRRLVRFSAAILSFVNSSETQLGHLDITQANVGLLTIF